MSQLLPPGITGLADCPYTLHEAIIGALHFLGYEELPSEDQPPKRIWLDGEAMSSWWRERTRARNKKYGIPDDAEESTFEENALADELIARG